MRRATHLLPRSIFQTPYRPASFVGNFRDRAASQFLLKQSPSSCLRTFTSTNIWREEKSHTERAKELSQKGLDKEEDWFNNQLDNAIGQQKEIQARTPWHREGADQPPVKRNRSAGAMTKGLIYSSYCLCEKLV